MQLKQDMDELEYLAELGFSKVSVGHKDIEDLKAQIKTRSFSYNSSWFFGMICLLLGAFFGLSLFFVFYETPLQRLKENHTVTANTQKVDVRDLESVKLLDTLTVQADNFRKDVGKKSLEPTASGSEEESLKPEMLEPIKINEIPSAKLDENKIKFMTNSPVFYIHDLKVTDYPILYFKRNKFIPTSGVAANFSNLKDQLPKSGLKSEAQMYLHEELGRALLLFKNKKYGEAIPVFEFISGHNEVDLNCSFYEAMSYFYLNQFSKATAFFNVCIDARNNSFLQEAQYYKALSLLKNGNKVEGKVLLEQIITEGEFYAAAAKLQLQEQVEIE